MNQYKRLAANTMIFAIGSFGSKILTLFLTKLYTANINPADISTKELLEQTANFLIPIVTFSITDAILRYGLTEIMTRGKFSRPLIWYLVWVSVSCLPCRRSCDYCPIQAAIYGF